MKKSLLLVCLFSAVLLASCDPSTPDTDSDTYQKVVKEFYMGVAAIQTGSDLGAKDMFLRASEMAPEETSIWVNLAIVSFRQGDFEESLSFIQKALDLDPSSAEVNRVKGLLDKALGDFESASQYFEKALDSNADDTKALYALYEIEKENGNTEKTKDLLGRLSRLLPLNQLVAIEELKGIVQNGSEDDILGQVHILAQLSGNWPKAAKDILADLDQSTSDRARLSSSLRNVLLREASFRRDIQEVQDPPELVSDLFDHFQKLPTPDAGPDSLDTGLRFEEIRSNKISSGGAQAALVFHGENQEPRFLEFGSGLARFLIQPEKEFDSSSLNGIGRIGAIANFDANHDYLMDLAAIHQGYLAIYQQDSLGAYTETNRLEGAYSGVWSVDFDLEGDMDLFVEGRGGSFVYRNNGDGSFAKTEFLPGAPRAAHFLWFDFDNDGDPDPILVTRNAAMKCFSNERSGLYLEHSCPTENSRIVAAEDLNQNGLVEILFQDPDSKQIKASEWDGAEWKSRFLAAPNHFVGEILTADVDNNGGTDLLLSSGPKTDIYLMDKNRTFQDPQISLEMRVDDIVDINEDGYLDLLGKKANVWFVALGKGSKNYHWQALSYRSANAKGDQRINSLAIGGMTEVRAALSYQKKLTTSPRVHLGLGIKNGVDVARFIWPNGDVQAEFDLGSDQEIVTRQRLKGSCPWLFSWNGEEMVFVTDFIWRSPLGLRINAQETAGIMSTEDRVRISGDKLKEKDGHYDIRITADLWESHFFDSIDLLSIDHPDSSEVFIDETFVFPPPDSSIYHTSKLRPVLSAIDQNGRDQSENVKLRDAQYFDGVPLGPFQGIAEEHFIQFEIDRSRRNDLLLAYGWVRPTDSSINVALGQGTVSKPEGVHLEGLGANGQWIRIKSNLGFPSGKHKTMIIKLEKSWSDSFSAFRLRTNMEIYWDQLASVTQFTNENLDITRLQMLKADLIYRGFSRVSEKNRFSPELPDYQTLESSEPVWRDLIGYYTRFGEVGELIAKVDDRYVIMNAGDEMQVSFEAASAIRPGQKRDFVLVGDGWVKDGDYNTVASKTLGPLPTHSNSSYELRETFLENDPVFLRHRGDWEQYHTRYVTDERFVNSLVVD